jgi:prepilin-type N-terminal cleavage/methylation domain-containing protein
MTQNKTHYTTCCTGYTEKNRFSVVSEKAKFKNKLVWGFTLVELMVASVLVSVVILAGTTVYVAGKQFLVTSQRQGDVQTEATFALRHISREVRRGSNVTATGSDILQVNLPAWTGVNWIRYRRLGSGELEYTVQAPGGQTVEVIATDITGFTSSTGTNQFDYVDINLTSQKGNELITLNAKVTLRNS